MPRQARPDVTRFTIEVQEEAIGFALQIGVFKSGRVVRRERARMFLTYAVSIRYGSFSLRASPDANTIGELSSIEALVHQGTRELANLPTCAAAHANLPHL